MQQFKLQKNIDERNVGKLLLTDQSTDNHINIFIFNRSDRPRIIKQLNCSLKGTSIRLVGGAFLSYAPPFSINPYEYKQLLNDNFICADGKKIPDEKIPDFLKMIKEEPKNFIIEDCEGNQWHP